MKINFIFITAMMKVISLKLKISREILEKQIWKQCPYLAGQSARLPWPRHQRSAAQQRRAAEGRLTPD